MNDRTICRISTGPQIPDDEPDYVRELEIEEAKGEDKRERERERDERD